MDSGFGDKMNPFAQKHGQIDTVWRYQDGTYIGFLMLDHIFREGEIHMKLKKLWLIMLLSPSAVLAYYGTPSFQLEDDPDYRQYQFNQQESKKRLAEAEQLRINKENEVKKLDHELLELRRRIQSIPQDKQKLEQERSALQNQIQNLKSEISLLETGFAQIKATADQSQAEFKIATATLESKKIELSNLNKTCVATPTPECQKAIEDKKAEITTLESEWVKIRDVNAQNKAKLEEAQKPLDRKRGELKTAEALLVSNETKLAELLKLEQNSVQRENQLLSELNRAKSDLLLLIRKLDDAERRMADSSRIFNQYRDDLIRSIDQVNREGYINGERDGDNDGTELSRMMGRDIGVRDGSNDGLIDGERAGRERDYNRGIQVGEREGADRGRLEGDRDGINKGRDAGHIDAGNREGQIAGIDRANKSDAAKVGDLQGKTDGLNRAIRTGMEIGSAKGEKEGIALFENTDLSQVELKGQFLGSFERRTPSMPGNYQGPRFNPNRPASKEVFKRAYLDGYVFKYRDEVVLEFSRRIDAEYNQSYDASYQDNYRTAVEREYRDTYEDGRRSQDARAYAREYKPSFDRAYQITFNETTAKPNRNDSVYKEAYRSMEAHAYSTRYEDIRSEVYARVEADTFSKNIAEKTEEFRQKRLAEVKALYENHPVAQYVSSSIQDGGNQGVAKLDGLYMPGEKIVRNIVIKNFGKKELVGAKAQFVTGEEVVLPNVPARSVTTIVAGAVSTIPANTKNGSAYKDHMRVQVQASSKDAVQTRHYEDLNKSLLKALDTKDVVAQYPLQLSGLALSDSFALLNKKVNLKANLANLSKRDYADEIQVDLTGSSSVITKPFNNINGLKMGSASLSDAEILVSSEKDTYVSLRVQGDLRIRGVKVGEFTSPLDFMARAPYVEKAGKAVLVTNSNVNTRDLLDTLDRFGGIAETSVLDLALANLNQAILTNGLTDKTAIIIDDGAGSITKLSEPLFNNSKNTVFVHADQNLGSLKVARTMGAFKDNQSFPFILAGTKIERRMYFTNQHRATSLKGMTMHVQTSLENAKAEFDLMSDFAQSNASIVQRAKKEINRNTFFTTQKSIQVAAIKSLGEIMNVSVAYDESGGIFRRDKKWITYLENEGSLVHNQMKANANGSLNEESVGLHLAAISFKDIVSNSLSYYRPVSGDMKLKVRSTVNDILGDMEDNFKKKLKSFDRGLYDKAYSKFEQHRPYTIDIPTNNN